LSKVAWARTDPSKSKDIFYWDVDKKFGDHVSKILAKQGSPPLHIYREVNKSQANSVSRPRREWVNALAKNSQTPRGMREGFALVFIDRPIANPKIIANAQTPSMDGVPIIFDLQKMKAKAGLLKMDESTVALPKTVAHEVGHKFGLEHPERCNPCALAMMTSQTLDQLLLGQVGMIENPTNKLYLRMEHYLDPLRGTAEYLADGPTFRWSGKFQEPISDPSIEIRDPASTRFHVVKYTFPVKTPPSADTPKVLVSVLKQELKIMDWTPRSTLRSADDWKFSTEHLNAICVRRKCF